MFVGHYGPSFAAKSARNSIPLWLLFIAVQLLDVIWSVFVMLGIEKLRIVPGITKTNALDLYYMPYTHSLDGALVLALGAGLVYWLWRREEGWRSAAVIAAAVFSHWVLDLLVHRPDLPLYDNSAKVGLGLWNLPLLALTLELLFLFGGIYLYLRSTQATGSVGRYGMIVLGVVMACIHVVAYFGAPPSTDRAAAIMALTVYFAFAPPVYWLEKKRVPRTKQGPLQAQAVRSS